MFNNIGSSILPYPLKIGNAYLKSVANGRVYDGYDDRIERLMGAIAPLSLSLGVRFLRTNKSKPSTMIAIEEYKLKGYKNFDRHSLFNVGDMTLVSDLITKSMANENRDRNLTNSLYGLYDGYLYDDLMQSAAFQLPTTDLMDLRKLVEKINSDISINGERTTRI
jgi:hypothetical protein